MKIIYLTTIYCVLLSNPHSGSPHIVSEATDGSSYAAAEALKHSFSYLVNNVDTDALLPAALSKHLITDHQRTECYNEADPYKKAEMFLGYLQQAVITGYDSYHTFVLILKQTGQLQTASHLHG